MGIALTTTLAFCAWIIMWALRVNGFDGLMVVTAVVLIAATIHSLAQYRPSGDERNADRGGW
jgi:hypothetical protein